jgi:hypothetical protein
MAHFFQGGELYTFNWTVIQRVLDTIGNSLLT